MSRPRNRQAEFAELQDRAPRDLDPESDAVPEDDDDDNVSDLDDGDDVNEARDHYVDVGKSKLRKPKEVNLGTRYRGAKITRDAAFDDDSDEDFPLEDDDHSASGDDYQSDVAMSSEPGELDEDEDEDQDEDEDEDAEDGEDTEDTEMSDQEDLQMPAPAIDKSELRRAMAADQKTITTSIIAATKSDADKGRAVKRQRTTYDSFLNTRIKMQKSLIAANSLVVLEPAQLQADTASNAVIEQAETAAYNLWSQLTAYREELSKSQLASQSTPTHSARSDADRLWSIQQVQDAAVRSHRDAVLQKWSLKSRGVAATAQRSRINNEKPATIVDVLNEQLSSTDRLMQRARTPRSSAPLQVAKRVHLDDRIYDDVDFYGMLLKELLDSKSSSTSTAAANVDVKTFMNVRREAKTRRNVDTKASKGRKLKYTVHEKLQNFCAPDDRTSWSERQTQELFLSLFGQQMGLREDVSAHDDSEEDAAEAGLMLFRSAA